MKLLKRLVVVALVAGCAVNAEAAKGDRKHGRDRQDKVATRTAVVRPAVFSPREVRILRDYYAPQYRSLPPGLQKKLRRTGQLPPGWQKKMRPFPVGIDRQLVVMPRGYSRGLVDGYGVIYDPRTHSIYDVARLF